MPPNDCARAEILAGAIALGEAQDDDRNSYREHLSRCPRCLSQIGGEREIERVIGLVARARAQERWQPEIRNVVARARSRPWLWPASIAVATAFVVALFAAQAHRPVVLRSVTAPARAVVATQQQSNAVAALGTQVRNARTQSAESLAVGQAEGNAASVTLRITLDARGKPASCTVVARARSAPDAGALCAAVLRKH